MVKVSVRSVRVAMTAYFDRVPALSVNVTGGPMREYHAGNRPGEAGPVRPSTMNMTADDDRALLLLSLGHPIRMSDLSHMGAYATRMMRSMRNLTSRGLAVFTAGAFRLTDHD